MVPPFGPLRAKALVHFTDGRKSALLRDLPIVHATVNNLQDVSVTIPTGVLTVITGVADSGKSSLITEAFLSQHQEAVVIDR